MSKLPRLLLPCIAVLLSLVAPDASAAPLWVSCKPVETAVFSNRIHVRCATPVDGRFAFFAAATTDARNAARILAVIEGAHLADKPLNVYFDPADTSLASIGCQAADCRPIIAIAIEEDMMPPDTCAFDNTRPGCANYCTAHPDEPGCPKYCATHNDPASCGKNCAQWDIPTCPGYCGRHPDAPKCQL
jgi:hypothetical protein